MLKLSKTYLHFDNLMWKLPSVGLAVVGGCLVAADRMGEDPGSWPIDVFFVQSGILVLGSVVILSLALTMNKFRLFQADARPQNIGNPPANRWPSAGRFFQLVLFFLFGSVLAFGLFVGLISVADLWLVVVFVVLGFSCGIVLHLVLEFRLNRDVRTIDARNAKSCSSG